MSSNNPEQSDHTLYAETIFHIGEFPVTNSMLSSWIVLVFIIITSLFLRKKINSIPRGLQNLLEMLFEWFYDIFYAISGNKKQVWKFLPLILSFFFFILLNNWFGLFPGVGSIGKYVVEDGHRVLVPLLRGGTADLNTTLALASVAVLLTHFFGVFTVGIWHHVNKFINFKAILEIPRKVWKDPAIILVNPIKLFVGVIEIIGELAKIASLSFRLFGNIFAGEVLIASMSVIFAFVLPVPFMFLEILVGAIQALIFSILVLIYLSLNLTVEEH